MGITLKGCTQINRENKCEERMGELKFASKKLWLQCLTWTYGYLSASCIIFGEDGQLS